MRRRSSSVNVLRAVDGVVAEIGVEDFVDADTGVLVVGESESLVFTDGAGAIGRTSGGGGAGGGPSDGLVSSLGHCGMIKGSNGRGAVNVDCGGRLYTGSGDICDVCMKLYPWYS